MRLKSCQVFFHRHQAPELLSVLTALAARSFTNVSSTAFVPFLGHGACPLGASTLPNMGKHVTQHGQARYPTWASTLPNMGKHVTPLGHVCCTDVAHLSPIWQTPSGLKQNPACPCFCDEPRLSVPPRMITHPNLPKGKGQVTLQLITVNHISPHLASKPILPFPKGRNKLLCFVKDFSKSIQPMNISPHLTSPEGEGQLLLLLIND